LRTLDLLVVPSASEGGIPMVILEAFAAGVPVLATAVGGVGEVLSDGQNGFLLPSPSASAIERRLRELLPHRDLLARAAERAHRIWRERFTAERYRNEVWETVASGVRLPVVCHDSVRQ
jgi:glycosyltransferase involved in cell wall biosynthesis